ncbi:DegQ family regulator [Aeribacillus sp. FSL K6-8394]
MNHQEIEKINKIFLLLERELDETKKALDNINKSIDKYDKYQYTKIV